jgi:para-aminobenzoate synthetase
MSKPQSSELTAHPRTVLCIEELAHEIGRKSNAAQRPITVALDGGSGAGKSTVANALRQHLDATVVPLDDFFSTSVPESAWPAMPYAERLQTVFEWQRVRADALEPLRRGERGRWHAFDFLQGLGPDGTWALQKEATEVEPAEIIILEGAYAASPALADLIDLAVLIEVSVDVRHKRLRDREEADFLAHWHELWDGFEAYYFDTVRTRESFDLVLATS